MRYELYINGEKVDMVQESITLTMKSNLLGDFGKIVAGSSQTVKLPMTSRNMRILGLPEIGTLDGGSVRRRLKAKLLSNGIEIINDGVAVILKSTEDSYEIGITYGVIAFLQAVKDMGNLQDIGNTGSVKWDEHSDINLPVVSSLGYRNYGFAAYDNGVNNTIYTNVTPCVSVEYLVSMILQKAEATFEMSNREKIVPYYILLTEKNNTIGNLNNTEATFSFAGFSYWEEYTGWAAIQQGATSVVLPDITLSKETIISDLKPFENVDVIMFNRDFPKVTVTFYVNGLDANGDDDISIERINLESRPQEVANVVYRGSNTMITATLYDVKNGEAVALLIDPASYKPASVYGSAKVKATYTEAEDVAYRHNYPITPNLPKMKATDIINMYGKLAGAFPIVKPNDMNTLYFARVKDLKNNRADGIVVDWSDKWDGEAEEVTYTHLEYRENNITYKDDKDVAPLDNGFVVTVNDDTLPKSGTLYEFPLSSSRNVGGRAYVPQFVLESDDEGKVTVDDGDVSERLLYVQQNNVAIFANPDGNYDNFKELVQSPVKIRGTFRLSEIDIKELDYMKPVYLRQTGRYYGIIQVQWKGDDSVVELLQLPR